MNTNKKTNRVRQYREALYLTQDELAAMIGVSGDTIGHIERGDNEPRVKTKRKLAEALKVPVSELFPPVEEKEQVFSPAA